MGASSSARMMRALGEGMAQSAESGRGAVRHAQLYNFRLDRAGMQVKRAAAGTTIMRACQCRCVGIHVQHLSSSSASFSSSLSDETLKQYG